MWWVLLLWESHLCARKETSSRHLCSGPKRQGWFILDSCQSFVWIWWEKTKKNPQAWMEQEAKVHWEKVKISPLNFITFVDGIQTTYLGVKLLPRDGQQQSLSWAGAWVDRWMSCRCEKENKARSRSVAPSLRLTEDRNTQKQENPNNTPGDLSTPQHPREKQAFNDYIYSLNVKWLFS